MSEQKSGEKPKAPTGRSYNKHKKTDNVHERLSKHLTGKSVDYNKRRFAVFQLTCFSTLVLGVVLGLAVWGVNNMLSHSKVFTGTEFTGQNNVSTSAGTITVQNDPVIINSVPVTFTINSQAHDGISIEDPFGKKWGPYYPSRAKKSFLSSDGFQCYKVRFLYTKGKLVFDATASPTNSQKGC